MEDRIQKFIEFKGISPSELADTIGVQRSNVTHVLKARNKPSFQFIEKLLQAYPELSAKWLLLGTGNMIDSTVKVSRTLFDAVPEPDSVSALRKPDEIMDEKRENLKQIEKQEVVAEMKAESTHEVTDNESEKEQKKTIPGPEEFYSSEKPIERLIVFFKDQTFKVYYPSR